MLDPNTDVIGMLSSISEGMMTLLSTKLQRMMSALVGEPSGVVLDVND
jgi:hypothetical protein